MSEKIYRVGDTEAPAGARFLHDYQEQSIQRMMVEPTKAILLASDTGMGKTVVVSEFIVRMGFKRVLLAGIRDTADQWADSLAAQSDGTIVLRPINATKAGKANLAALLAGEDGVFFSGTQFLERQDYRYEEKRDVTGALVYEVDKNTGLPSTKVAKVRFHEFTYKRMRPLDLMLVDEVHVAASRKNLIRRTLITIPTVWKVGVSATFYGNSFSGAWSVCNWLWPNLVDSSFVRWAEDWCERSTVYVAGGKKVDHIDGEKEPGKWVSQLPCFLRTESDDDVPAPAIYYVDLLPEQQVVYDSLVEDGMAWLESHHPGLEPLVASLPIVKRTRLRQAALGVMSFDRDGEVQFDVECRSTKLYALRQILDAWGDQPVIVYCESKRFVKVTVERMRRAGHAAAEWSGDVSAKERAQIKADFLKADGTVQYIVAVISSFSTGLNSFQGVCNKICWLSRSDDNRHNLQAVARIFRQGMTQANGGFAQVEIIARGTVDENVFSRKVAETRALGVTLRQAA